MLCFLLVLTYTISQLDAYKTYQLNCTLPAYPKNGFYNVEDHNRPVGPGDQVKTYRIKMCCEDGYGSLGGDTMACYDDGSVLYTDFECLPYCKQAHSLLTCGTEQRCIEPHSPGPVTPYMLRQSGTENFEECGLSDPVTVPSRRKRQIRLSLLPQTYSGNPYVAGGVNAKRDEMPWHAGIYSKKTSPYMQICGGTLVSHNVVISAAHCFWSESGGQQPAAEYAVAVGKLYRPWNETNDKNAQQSDVAEIRIPPYFQGHETNLQQDIALLILQSPFNFTKSVRPVCLDFRLEEDQKQLAPDSIGYVAGWGLTSEEGPASPVLKKAKLPVLELQKCFEQSDPKFRAYITNDKICAGWGNGTAVCKGDSGGGFFIPEWSTGIRRFYLRGVVSGAPQSEHLCNIYTWATFTHVLKHERFIRDTLQEKSAADTSSQVPDQSAIYFRDDYD